MPIQHDIADIILLPEQIPVEIVQLKSSAAISVDKCIDSFRGGHLPSTYGLIKNIMLLLIILHYFQSIA